MLDNKKPSNEIDSTSQNGLNSLKTKRQKYLVQNRSCLKNGIRRKSLNCSNFDYCAF